MAYYSKTCNIERSHPNPKEEKIIGSQPGGKKIEAMVLHSALTAKLLSSQDSKDSQILKIVFGSEQVGERVLFHTWSWQIKTQIYEGNNKVIY